jgi:TPR repeat protein
MAYFHGEGCEQNVEKAVEALRAAGRAGERGAQGAFYLGMAYIEGNKVEKDIGRGHRWLRQAAQFKHAEANYQLGASMIASGNPEQLSRGCDYITIAAELGHEK